MIRSNVIILWTICILSLAAPGFITAAPGTIAVKDLDGRPHSFFSQTNAGTKAVIFVFILPDCPISNSYAPELKRLHNAFPTMEFYLVYADPDLTTTEARKHAKSYGFGFPGLLDPSQQLVRKSGATRTPEAVVFSPDGKILYRGRIDDRYVDFGKKRDHPRHRDLQRALRSVLENKPARWPDEPPIGCYIPH